MRPGVSVVGDQVVVTWDQSGRVGVAVWTLRLDPQPDTGGDTWNDDTADSEDDTADGDEGGVGETPPGEENCGCSIASGSALGWLAMVSALVVFRRRTAARAPRRLPLCADRQCSEREA